ncbi:MAG: hypothetical protein EYC70_01255 [Planctomycetota bacterium]|nr:MAG: hypothetical protein EYC70_01255 [Planctomycetota bacterium]
MRRGLTPFDARVSEHVKAAGASLRQAAREQSESLSQLMAEQRLGLLGTNEFNDRLNAINKAGQSKRHAAIDQLIAALDELPQ